MPVSRTPTAGATRPHGPHGPVNSLAHAELWGGPEDGERVWVPALLPELIGVQRMPDGALVPVRDQRALQQPATGTAVYRLASRGTYDGRVGPLYRWCSRPPGQVPA